MDVDQLDVRVVDGVLSGGADRYGCSCFALSPPRGGGDPDGAGGAELFEGHLRKLVPLRVRGGAVCAGHHGQLRAGFTLRVGIPRQVSQSVDQSASPRLALLASSLFYVTEQQQLERGTKPVGLGAWNESCDYFACRWATAVYLNCSTKKKFCTFPARQAFSLLIVLFFTPPFCLSLSCPYRNVLTLFPFRDVCASRTTMSLRLGARRRRHGTRNSEQRPQHGMGHS